jgi:hypothetical protein
LFFAQFVSLDHSKLAPYSRSIVQLFLTFPPVLNVDSP